MLKIANVCNGAIKRSINEPNIFRRLRLIIPGNQFEGAIIYDEPNRGRIAMSWELISHINCVPSEIWRNNQWLISFWGTYIYNWNNDSSIRNSQVGSERRVLSNIWFWLISSFTSGLLTSEFHNLYAHQPSAGGVYISITLDEHALNPIVTPTWEIWNNQFNLNDC